MAPPVPDPAAQVREWARRARHAWSLLDAGDVAGARAVRDGLGGAGALPPHLEERIELELLDAGLALGRGAVDAAAETLHSLGAGSATGHLRFALLRADVAAAWGDH
ncbi:MAG: hypothetical protein OXH75_20730, partial [Acidobacteria bacterium]|nr:hypothetical protein [Acidobacteriota bacterium]